MLKVAVGIGISTYNGANRIDEVLASLQKCTEPLDGGYEVYVLDDGGKETNFERLKEVCANYGAGCDHHEINFGISKTWNDLTRHFNSEYMVLLNDDLILADRWLCSLVYFAENNKFATAGLPMFVPKKTGKPDSGWKKSSHGWDPFLVFPKTKPLRSPSAPGPCFIFKRSLYDFAGGFDERYVSFYEEVDFSLTLARFGYASFTLPYPWTYHYWARSFAENPELNPNQRMALSRGRFFEKWGGELTEVYLRTAKLIPQQQLKWLMNKEKREELEEPFTMPKGWIEAKGEQK